MRNLTILLAALIAAAVVQPAGAAERKFSISGFDNIRVRGGVNVIITTGKGPSAKAQGTTRKILDRVSLERNGDQLVVSMRPKSISGGRHSSDEPVTIHMTAHNIKSITHLGSGRVTLDSLSGRSPRARLGGFGTMQIGNVDSDKLDIAMTGGGHLTITGKARDVRITLQGASIFDGSALTAEKLILVHRGPSGSHIAVTREADINNNGTGVIRIDGRPNCKVRTDGSAEIICNPKR